MFTNASGADVAHRPDEREALGLCGMYSRTPPTSMAQKNPAGWSSSGAWLAVAVLTTPSSRRTARVTPL